MKTSFYCPLCRSEVEIRNVYAIASRDADEIGIRNKRHHMKTHKIIKRLSKRKELLEQKISEINNSLETYIDVYGIEAVNRIRAAC